MAAKQLLRPGPVEERQMAQEIALLSGLYSPNVVRFLGADLAPGQKMMIFTEYCERGDLYQALRDDADAGSKQRQLGWHGRLALGQD